MKIFKKIFKSNTLYYPGCLSKFVAKDLVENYRRILREAGLDFIELADLEVCCGSPALKAGYADDFKKLAEKNLQVFKEHSVGRIVTHCPACFMIFKKEYPKVFGEKWDIEVTHATEILSKTKIQNSKFKIQNSVVTYHDPCHLGRQMGIYDEPREVLKSLGYEIKEMDLSRKESFCCGGGGGVQSNESELANKIAKDRIAMAKKTGAKVLVTPCPLCYMHLKKNAEGEDIEVKELSHLM
ncbi:(Fe-S)-binding protein [Candidatus Falkowbacteria bacterium]|nr:(Fe-S)-binding protein [Candidatus Falkowbacteria bacterium]